jgi:hypothetical protein
MIYNNCTFIGLLRYVFPLQTYFLPTHRNGEVMVLRKLPYMLTSFEIGVHNILEQCWGNPFAFQESKAVNRENIHSLVTSTHSQIEFKLFPKHRGEVSFGIC